MTGQAVTMATTVPVVAFNYDLVAEDYQATLMAAAERIRNRAHRACTDIIEIGQDLLTIKAELDHGLFLGWIEAEFRWSDRTAAYYMAVAREWGDVKFAPGADLPIKLLCELSSKNTPADIKTEVRADLEAGKPVDVKAIKSRIKDATKARRHPPVEQVQHSVETAIATPVATDMVTTEPHIADRQFGPLSGGEWLWLGEDCRRRTGRGKKRRHFYSDEFMKLVAFHSVPIQDLEVAE